MKLEKFNAALVTLTLALTSLLITPWINLDPINPVKLFSLISLGGLLLATTFWQKTWINSRLKGQGRAVVYLISFSAAWIVASSITNSYSLDERIFGIYGRNLGALTYLALFGLLFCVYLLNFQDLNRLMLLLSNVGVVIGFYFLLQKFELDPFFWEEAPGGVPSSTLGNPNFLSSQVSILVLIPISFIIFSKTQRVAFKFASTASVLLGVYVVIESESLQGFVILLACSLFFVLVKLKYLWSTFLTQLLRFSLFSLVPILSFITLLIASGLLGVTGGQTLMARRDYWNSAYNAILDNPLFGLGFDSFGDYYFRYRDLISAERNMGFLSNSPHNLLLELGNSAGLPLLITYLTIQFLASRSAFRILSNTNSSAEIAVISCWIGFNLQSLINPGNIATLTLGFVLTGLVLNRGEDLNSSTVALTRSRVGSRNSRRIKYRELIAFSLTFFVVIPSVYLSQIPFDKDLDFRQALERGDGAAAIAIVERWPFNYEFARITAVTLQTSNFPELSEKIVEDMTKINPNNILGWRLMYETFGDPNVRDRALSQMRRLDPLNNELRNLTP